MSYSFLITAPTKPELLVLVGERFGEIIANSCPEHARDEGAALTNLQGCLDQLPDEAPAAGYVLYANLSGHLSWVSSPPDSAVDRLYTSCSINASASWGSPATA